jgi:hypothetical protein
MSEGPNRRWFWLALCGLFVLFVGCGWLWWASQRGWTVANVEQLIQAELSPECDRATAEAWFTRHGVQFTWHEDTTGDVRGRQTIPELVGLKNEELSGMLRGRIDPPEANLSLMFPGRISIYFFFDKNGRQVGRLVEPFVYMP